VGPLGGRRQRKQGRLIPNELVAGKHIERREGGGSLGACRLKELCGRVGDEKEKSHCFIQNGKTGSHLGKNLKGPEINL